MGFPKARFGESGLQCVALQLVGSHDGEVAGFLVEGVFECVRIAVSGLPEQSVDVASGCGHGEHRRARGRRGRSAKGGKRAVAGADDEVGIRGQRGVGVDGGAQVHVEQRRPLGVQPDGVAGLGAEVEVITVVEDR